MRSAAAVLLLALVVAGCSSFGGGAPREDLPPPPDPDRYEADVGARQLWSQSLDDLPVRPGFALRPAVADGRVFVADAAGGVYAYEAESGKPLWQRDLGRPLAGGPGASRDLVVVGTRDGEAVGLRANDGEVLWRSGVTSEVLAQPAVGADLVVVRVADGRVFGLESETGRRRWLYEQSVPVLTLRGTSSPILVPGQVVLVGLDTGKLVAIAPENGRALWETAVASPSGRSDLERMVDIDADPVVFRAEAYAATYNGRVAAIDGSSGRVRWDRELSVHAGLAVDSARLYTTDAERRVWALDRFSGASVWRNDELRGLTLTGPAKYGEYLLVGDSDGYLNWLAERDGTLQRRQRIGGAFVAAPVVEGGAIYLLTETGLTVLGRAQ